MSATRQLAARLGQALDDELVERLDALLALTMKWGKRTDLTSARSPEALAEILFVDALMLRETALVPPAARLVDVGAGVGAPTLPLCMLRPDISAVLLEPRRKRVAFMRTVVGTFDWMDRVTVLEGRLDLEEPRVDDGGKAFDVALSRATFAPPTWLAAGQQLAPRVLALTAQEDPPEVDGLRRGEVVRYVVPSNRARRSVTVYERV